MTTTITITMEWWPTGEGNEDCGFSQYHESLKELGLKRAIEMMQEGYRGGDLCDDGDNEDLVTHRGWWSVIEEIKS